MKHFRNHRSQILCVTLCISLCTLISCGGPEDVPAPETTLIKGSTMGTYYRVTVADPIEDEESLRKGIEATLDRIDRLMSTYREDSELSRLNRLEGGEWFTLSEEVGNVLDIAIDVHQLSGGALDVTAGPLVNLWHFGPEPSDEDTVLKLFHLHGADQRCRFVNG